MRAKEAAVFEADLMRRLKRPAASEDGEDMQQTQYWLPSLPSTDPKRIASACQGIQLLLGLLATAAAYSEDEYMEAKSHAF